MRCLVYHYRMYGTTFYRWVLRQLKRLGYPTQKPLSLLERIIQTSSNPGDIRARSLLRLRHYKYAAAQKLERKWIGIDTHRAEYRPPKISARGECLLLVLPSRLSANQRTFHDARKLAEADRYQNPVVGPFPYTGRNHIRQCQIPASKTGKKGSDKGIDVSVELVPMMRAAKQKSAVTCR